MNDLRVQVADLHTQGDYPHNYNPLYGSASLAANSTANDGEPICSTFIGMVLGFQCEKWVRHSSWLAISDLLVCQYNKRRPD
jgi:hypothetical protein